MKGLKIRIGCKLDEFLHETMAMMKSTSDVSLETRTHVIMLWMRTSGVPLAKSGCERSLGKADRPRRRPRDGVSWPRYQQDSESAPCQCIRKELSSPIYGSKQELASDTALCSLLNLRLEAQRRKSDPPSEIWRRLGLALIDWQNSFLLGFS